MTFILLLLRLLFLSYIGALLMRLVVVQVIDDGSAARWCFVTVFALSMSLFTAVLVDIAKESIKPSAGPLASATGPTGVTAVALHAGMTTGVSMWLAQALSSLLDCMSLNEQLFSSQLALLLCCVVVWCPCACVVPLFTRRYCLRHRRRMTSRNSLQNQKTTTRPLRHRRIVAVFAFIVFLLLFFLWAGTGKRRGGFSAVTGAVAPKWASIRLSLSDQFHRALQYIAKWRDHVIANTTLLQVPKEVNFSLRPTPMVPTFPASQSAMEVAGAEAAPSEGRPPSTPSDAISESITSDSFPAAVSITFLRQVICAVTSRLATVGIALMGLLSGYAAVATPHLYLMPYSYWRGREADLLKARQSFGRKLRFVLGRLSVTEHRIAALEYSVLHDSGAAEAVAPRPAQSVLHDAGNDTVGPGSLHTGKTTPPTNGAGMMGWMTSKIASAASAFRNGGGAAGQSSLSASIRARQEAQQRLSQLRRESAASHFMSRSLFLQLHEVDGMLSNAARGGTWVGCWYAGIGVAMACYSFIKICLTVASLALFRASTQDPVTRAVSLLESALILRRRQGAAAEGTATAAVASFSITAVEVSTHVILTLALVVNGWMVLSSIRGALLALFSLTVSLRSNTGLMTPELIVIGLSMLMGVYFTGQLVLLRASLPSAVHGDDAGTGWAASAQAASTPGALHMTQSYHSGARQNVLLAVLGSLPYYFYQRLNDWCFMIGCVGAAVVRWRLLPDMATSVVNTATGGGGDEGETEATSSR